MGPDRLLRTTALLAVLMLAAASCGGNGDDGTEAEGISGRISVVNTWSGSELEAFEAVIAGFEERNPDVTVELLQIPFPELNAQLTQQFAAGDPPDVTVALPGLIRQLAGGGFLKPLDELWDGWVADGEYTDSLRQIASVDGTAYGVWFKGNVNGLIWYRPQQMQELGIDVPAETWDQFVGALQRAKDEGVEPVAVGGADQWPLTQWWDPILVRVGGVDAFNGLVDGSVGWDDPRVVRSFEVFGELIADYFPGNVLDRGFIDEVCAWVDGTAAFINQGAFINLVAPGECDESLRPGEDFTFFAMPGFDQPEPPAQFVSGDLFAVAEETQNEAAAVALVEYLGSADAQAIWAERGGFVAPNAEVSLDVYPDENDRKAAELWPRDPADQAVYDLDDFIGGEIQSTLREALQQFVRDQDVDRIVSTMTAVDTRAQGG